MKDANEEALDAYMDSIEKAEKITEYILERCTKQFEDIDKALAEIQSVIDEYDIDTNADMFVKEHL